MHNHSWFPLYLKMANSWLSTPKVLSSELLLKMTLNWPVKEFYKTERITKHQREQSSPWQGCIEINQGSTTKKNSIHPNSKNAFFRFKLKKKERKNNFFDWLWRQIGCNGCLKLKGSCSVTWTRVTNRSFLSGIKTRFIRRPFRQVGVTLNRRPGSAASFIGLAIPGLFFCIFVFSIEMYTW